MEFSVDSKSLMETIGRARKVCPRALDVNIVGGKKGAWLVITSDGVSAKFAIPNIEVSDAGDPVTIPVDGLLGAIKGRKILNFAVKDGSLVFNDGARYTGDVKIPDYAEIELVKPKGGVELDLSDDTAGLFNDISALAYLSGEFGKSDNMSLYISMGKGGITALCYDSYYLVRVSDNSQEFAEQTIALDQYILSIVTAVAGKQSYKLLLTDDSLYAYNQEFMLRYPNIQVDNVDENITNISEYVDQWLSEDCTRVTADLGKFQEVLGNISAFYERGVPIDFLVSKQGVGISIDGKGGAVQERVTGTTKNPVKDRFHCEYLLISELLPKVAGPTVEISFIPDRVVYFHQDDGVRSLFASAALVAD